MNLCSGCDGMSIWEIAHRNGHDFCKKLYLTLRPNFHLRFQLKDNAHNAGKTIFFSFFLFSCLPHSVHHLHCAFHNEKYLKLYSIEGKQINAIHFWLHRDDSGWTCFSSFSFLFFLFSNFCAATKQTKWHYSSLLLDSSDTQLYYLRKEHLFTLRQFSVFAIFI